METKVNKTFVFFVSILFLSGKILIFSWSNCFFTGASNLSVRSWRNGKCSSRCDARHIDLFGPKSFDRRCFQNDQARFWFWTSSFSFDLNNQSNTNRSNWFFKAEIIGVPILLLIEDSERDGFSKFLNDSSPSLSFHFLEQTFTKTFTFFSAFDVCSVRMITAMSNEFRQVKVHRKRKINADSVGKNAFKSFDFIFLEIQTIRSCESTMFYGLSTY